VCQKNGEIPVTASSDSLSTYFSLANDFSLDYKRKRLIIYKKHLILMVVGNDSKSVGDSNRLLLEEQPCSLGSASLG
jgi:hypothetical protein